MLRRCGPAVDGSGRGNHAIPSSPALWIRFMTNLLRSFLLLLALSTAALAFDDQAVADLPVPAASVPGKIQLPEGFQTTLFIGEPDLVQPMAITFDDRGRMWVVESLAYPAWLTTGTGTDRITILEDRDGDGKFDNRKV